MGKEIGRYVGSEVIRTENFDSEELIQEIKKEIKKNVFIGNLPKGDYAVFLRDSLAGVSVNIDVGIEGTFSEDNEIEYKEILKDVIGKYNFNLGGNILDYNNQRFFEGDIVFW